MSKGKHLTLAEELLIRKLLFEGKTGRQIAKEIGCHHNAIFRRIVAIIPAPKGKRRTTSYIAQYLLSKQAKDESQPVAKPEPLPPPRTPRPLARRMIV